MEFLFKDGYPDYYPYVFLIIFFVYYIVYLIISKLHDYENNLIIQKIDEHVYKKAIDDEKEVIRKFNEDTMEREKRLFYFPTYLPLNLPLNAEEEDIRKFNLTTQVNKIGNFLDRQNKIDNYVLPSLNSLNINSGCSGIISVPKELSEPDIITNKENGILEHVKCPGCYKQYVKLPDKCEHCGTVFK